MLECIRLTQVSLGHRPQNQNQERLAELERLFAAIRSAPLDVVDEIVWRIRASRGAAERRGFPSAGKRGSQSPGKYLCALFGPSFF